MNKYWLSLSIIIAFEVILWIGHISNNMLSPSIGLVIGGLISLILITIQERKDKIQFEKEIKEWQEQRFKQIQENIKCLNEINERQE